MERPDSFMASPTSLAWRLPTTVRGQSRVKPSGPPRLLGTLGGMLRSFLWYLGERGVVIIMFVLPNSLSVAYLPSLSKEYGIHSPKVKSTRSPCLVMKSCLGPRGLVGVLEETSSSPCGSNSS